MKKDEKGTSFWFFVIIIVLYSLFYRPADGDFWHYLELYELGDEGYVRHMENIYYWLINVLPHNYIIWRIAVWLPAAILIAISMRMMKLPSSYAITSFLTFGLPAYYYTRNALALAILYLAVTVFCLKSKTTKRRSFLYIILFFLLAFSSWFFHRSMPLYILFAIISLVIPFRREYLLGALIGFPIMYEAIVLLAGDFLSFGELWMSDDVGMNYLEQANMATVNWKGFIGLMIGYAPVLYFYYIAFFFPINKQAPEFQFYKSFLIFCFLLFYLSFLFYGQGSASIQSRLYKSTMIPFSFVVAIYFKYYLRTKRCRIFIDLFLVSIAFNIVIKIIGIL